MVAVADAERERSESAILNQSPLLINKIIAERLSDKIQVMMVPSDGKFFFITTSFVDSMPTQPCSRRCRAMTPAKTNPSAGGH